jgi:Protein of unknown function (DUF3572)
MKLGPPLTQQAAEGLAIQALTFIAGDDERLGSFLAATGLGPAEIRAASAEPGFLAGVLGYLASDDRLIADFAATTGCDPGEVGRAYAALGGEPWEREVP